jgi:hypothetical protein
MQANGVFADGGIRYDSIVRFVFGIEEDNSNFSIREFSLENDIEEMVTDLICDHYINHIFRGCIPLPKTNQLS